MQFDNGKSEDKFTVEGYALDRVYSRATNQYGIGQQQKTTFQAGVMAAMSKIVNQPGTEYGSLADFVRDSVVHRLQYWYEHGIEADAAVMRQIAAEEEQLQIQRWNALIDQRREQLRAGNQAYRDYVLSEIQHDLITVPSRFDWVRDALAALR